METPLVIIRQHPLQASATNLAVAADIPERLSVLHEALRQNRQAADGSICLQLALRMLLQILSRAAGFARRGEIGTALGVLYYAPRAAHLAFPK